MRKDRNNCTFCTVCEDAFRTVTRYVNSCSAVAVSGKSSWIMRSYRGGCGVVAVSGPGVVVVSGPVVVVVVSGPVVVVVSGPGVVVVVVVVLVHGVVPVTEFGCVGRVYCIPFPFASGKSYVHFHAFPFGPKTLFVLTHPFALTDPPLPEVMLDILVFGDFMSGSEDLPFP